MNQAQPAQEAPDARAGGKRWLGWVIPTIVIVLAGAFIVHHQHRRIDQIKQKPPYQGVTYTATSGDRLLPVSGGYRLFLGDLLWLRSIQSFGGMFRGHRAFASLYNLFFVITDLDPHFIEAYKFGNLVIGDEGKNFELALDLFDKGMVENPRAWRLPYEAAYCLIYSMKRNDENRLRAMYYLTMAIKDPQCPDYVNRMLIDLRSKRGDHTVALAFAMNGLVDAAMNRDPVVRGIHFRRLLTAVYYWLQDSLIEEARAFKERHGRDPESVEEMFEKNPGFTYPTLDLYRVNALIDDALEKGVDLTGRAEEVMERSMYMADQPPVDPRVLDDVNRRTERVPLVVVKGKTLEDGRDFIKSEDDVVADMTTFLGNIRYQAYQYYAKHKSLPEDIHKIIGYDKRLPPEPLGGDWIWDPTLMGGADEDFNKYIFRSSTRPDL